MSAEIARRLREKQALCSAISAAPVSQTPVADRLRTKRAAQGDFSAPVSALRPLSAAGRDFRPTETARPAAGVSRAERAAAKYPGYDAARYAGKTGREIAGEMQRKRAEADRAALTLSGAIDTANAGYVNALGTVLDLAQRYNVGAMYNNTEDWQNAVRDAQTAPSWKAVDVLHSKADELNASGAQSIEKAKEGLSGFGRTLVDVGVSGTQMLGDAAVKLVAPGAGLAAMGVRAFGSAAADARQRGADVARQAGYGAAVAAVEVISEKLFDGLAGIYGAGAADDLVEKIIGKMTKRAGGQMALKVLSSGVEEAGEEVLSGIVGPALESIIDNAGAFSHYSKDTLADVAQSALVGGILGVLGGGTALIGNAGAGADSGTERQNVSGAERRLRAAPETAEKTAIEGEMNPDSNASKAGAKSGTENRPAPDETSGTRFSLKDSEVIGFDIKVDDARIKRLNGDPRFSLKSPGETPTTAQRVRENADGAAPARAEDRSAAHGERAGMPSRVPGLHGADYAYAVRTYGKKKADRIHDVSKRLGAEVRFDDLVGGGLANASITGRVIRVERGNPNPIFSVLGHEWTHRVQDAAPVAETPAPEYTGSAETVEEAKAELKKAIRMPVKGTNAEALRVGAENGELSLDSVTMGGSVPGFTAEQRRSLATQIIQGVGKDGSSIRANVPGDGTFTIENAVNGGETAKENGNNENLERSRRANQTSDAGAQEKNGDRPGVQSGVRKTPEDVRGESDRVSAQGLSVEEAAAKELAEYGAKTHIIDKSKWDHKELAFTRDGEVYMLSGIPEEYRGIIAPHEGTHIMKQASYAPYMDFVKRTPDMMDMHSRSFDTLLQYIAEQRGVDPFDLTDGDLITLYDEINATVYGHIKAGRVNSDLITGLRDAFKDLDAYFSELDSIHEQFKNDRRGGITGTQGGTDNGGNGEVAEVSDTAGVQQPAARGAGNGDVLDGLAPEDVQASAGGGDESRGVLRPEGERVRGHAARPDGTGDGRGRRVGDREAGDLSSAGEVTQGARSYPGITAYKSSESYKINGAINEGKPLSPQLEALATTIEEELETLPEYEGGTLYRNLLFDDSGGEEARDAFIAKHVVGKKIKYNAFTSTSKAPEGYPVDGDYPVYIVITGKNGKDLSGIGYNFENEVLYKRGAEFFVDDIVYDENGTPTIILEEVGYGEIQKGEPGDGSASRRGRGVQPRESDHGSGGGDRGTDAGRNGGLEETDGEAKENGEVATEHEVEVKSETALQEQPKGSNFVIPAAGLKLPSGEHARAKANIQAIKTLRTIMADRSASHGKRAGMPSRVPGLHGEDYAYAVRTYGKKKADRIHDVSKRLGAEVRFDDLVGGGLANASITGRVIRVERGNPNPIFSVLGHEWTHRVQDAAPDAYREFLDAVRGEIAGEADRIAAGCKSMGRSVSREAALDEAAADYAGRMLSDGRILDDFIEKNRSRPNVLRKLWESIRAILNGLTKEQRQLAANAEQKLRAALEAAEKAVEQEKPDAGAADDEEVRFSRKKWHTGWPSKDVVALRNTLRYDVRVSGNRISGDANWYYSQKNGKTIFAVYSTVDIDDPTILYASRDEQAIVDMEYFVEEWKEYVNGADQPECETDPHAERHGRDNGTDDPDRHSAAYGRDAAGDAGLAGRKSGRKPCHALRNVLENLSKE